MNRFFALDGSRQRRWSCPHPRATPGRATPTRQCHHKPRPGGDNLTAEGKGEWSSTLVEAPVRAGPTVGSRPDKSWPSGAIQPLAEAMTVPLTCLRREGFEHNSQRVAQVSAVRWRARPAEGWNPFHNSPLILGGESWRSSVVSPVEEKTGATRRQSRVVELSHLSLTLYKKSAIAHFHQPAHVRPVGSRRGAGAVGPPT